MSTFIDELFRISTALGAFVFGKVAAYLLGFYIFAGLFQLWLSDPGELTFTVVHPFSQEAGIVLFGLGYLLVLHFIRAMYFWCQARGFKTFERYPERLTDCVINITVAHLIAYPLPLALWAIFGNKNGHINYYLIAALFVGVGMSHLILTANWNYGFTRVGSRTKPANENTRIKNNEVESSPHTEVARQEVPLVTFENIMGNTAIKRRLLDAAKAITANDNGDSVHRNGILLHGEPGNGKTIFAEALAGELKRPILKLTHSDVASRWVGERTEKIKAAFDQAIRSQPCVLFIDEIDSFIPDRSGAGTQTKEDTDVVNSLLTLLVDVRKHKVVVMAATNYMDRLDGAAVREGRFDFKVEITPPDEEARVGLLSSGLKKNMKKVIADQSTIQNVAQRWNGFSVKRILAVTEELPSYWAELQESGTVKTKLEYDDFMAALRRIQGRKGSSPENVKPMSDLMFPEVTKEALNMLSSRLRDPQRVERLGGTLPSGVLFYGPPGTGKTAACKALAKEVQWAFLIATGTDLARDPKGLDKLYAQAKELRPCIVFIDEADDLVRSREYSSNTEATNKLLTIMDGVNDRVRDVVWIAATNHPDQMDQALLRGGRFTEKVEFVRPDEGQLSVHIGKWLQTRKIALETGLTADRVAALVGDESIANLEAVLQYAVNRSISKSTDDQALVLSSDDLKRGVTMVLGAAC